MWKISNLWFSEDDDMVFGVKSSFINEDEFIKKANKKHVELSGYGCIVDEIETDVFIFVDETLKGERVYKLKDNGITIETLYYADCESLKNYDTEDNDGTVELEDGIVINLKGERISECNSCGTIILYEDYKNNNGFCEECLYKYD